MSVLEKIVSWSESRPIWQRDALRRLLQHTQLTQTDIAELTQLCLKTHGIEDGETPAPPALPLSKAHVGGVGGVGARVRLAGVRDVRHVNALASGRVLGFWPSGLTAVYGDNGSGKSGYTRILKTVCRARGAIPKIHPNIFVDSTPGAAAAEIDYLVEDDPRTHEWKDGIHGPDELAGISVFDTTCAAVYVEGKTDVAFRPFGLDLFPKLAQTCDRVKTAISLKVAAEGPGRSFAEISGETKAGDLIRALGSKNASAALEKLSALDAEALQRFDELEKIVAQLNANDPRKRAAELRLRAARFRALVEHATRVDNLLRQENADALQLAHEQMRATNKAAELASGEAFEGETLPGVGGTVWKALWAAARRYSESEPYRDEDFPVTRAGALCVLCQQELLPDGASRLNRFERFVQQEAQAAAQSAAAKFDALYALFADFAVARQDDENVLAEVLAQERGLHDSFRLFFAQMQQRLDALRAACTSGDWNSVPDARLSPCARLLQVIEELESMAEQLDEAGEEASAKAVRREHAELLDRSKLAKVKTEVLAEINRQRRVAALKACLKDTDTTGVTTKSTELTKSEVTEELRARFAQELHDLNLHHLSVSVAPEHGAKGTMYHKVAFDDAKTTGWGVQDVLSEGEHRCIALAAFLAELSTQLVASTVILDDPVSSLDHTRREFVATRLVREAAKRPVIVLTHDIVFLLLLQEQADQQDVAFTGRFLDRAKGELGVPVDGLPWYGMPIKKRVSWLRDETVQLKKTYKNDGTDAYEREAAFLWGRLREAWECAVEEVLLAGAVKRFSRRVSTEPLRFVHDITEADIAAVDTGMTACSTWLPGHDQAAALNTKMPAPEVLEAAVEMLSAWRETIIKRREKKKAS